VVGVIVSQDKGMSNRNLLTEGISDAEASIDGTASCASFLPRLILPVGSLVGHTRSKRQHGAVSHPPAGDPSESGVIMSINVI